MKTKAETKAEIARIFQSLRETYGLKPLGADALKMTVNMWWPYSAERLKEAISKLPQTQQFYPSPGQLRGYVRHRSPSESHRLVDYNLGNWFPTQTSPWRQSQIDEAALTLGIPKDWIKEGEI